MGKGNSAKPVKIPKTRETNGPTTRVGPTKPARRGAPHRGK